MPTRSNSHTFEGSLDLGVSLSGKVGSAALANGRPTVDLVLPMIWLRTRMNVVKWTIRSSWAHRRGSTVVASSFDLWA